MRRGSGHCDKTTQRCHRSNARVLSYYRSLTIAAVIVLYVVWLQVPVHHYRYPTESEGDDYTGIAALFEGVFSLLGDGDHIITLIGLPPSILVTVGVIGLIARLPELAVGSGLLALVLATFLSLGFVHRTLILPGFYCWLIAVCLLTAFGFADWFLDKE